MGVNIKITSGPAVERAGDLAAILTNLNEGDILFIDEIHRLGRAVEEILYPAMEDYSLDIIIGKGPSARSVRLKLPRFTIVGATTRLALVTAPLRARFGAVYRLDFYLSDAITEIVRQASKRLEVPSNRDRLPVPRYTPGSSPAAETGARLCAGPGKGSDYTGYN